MVNEWERWRVYVLNMYIENLWDFILFLLFEKWLIKIEVIWMVVMYIKFFIDLLEKSNKIVDNILELSVDEIFYSLDLIFIDMVGW